MDKRMSLSFSNPINKFEIHLEHDIDEQYQYEPGEVIRGKILLSAQDDLRIKGIQLQVRGEATVAWDEEGEGQFSTSETYVDDTIDVLGGQDVNVVSVTRGQHSYPIEYVLPQDLPSSFIGKFGSITYVMKATLKEDNRMGFGAVITSEPFLVLRGLDVLGQPDLQTAKKVALSKAAAANCFRICDFGKTTGEFTVDRTGFLSGDDVTIDAEILNNSARSVTSIQASLVLNSTFHAKNKARRHCQLVAKKTDSCDVDDGDVRRWTAVKLSVPPYIPESRLDGCDMIDIDYELQFRVEIDGGGSMRASLPVTIGTPTDEKKRAERRTWTLDNEANGGTGNGEEEHDGEVLDKFRHPMTEGETRHNLLFDDDAVAENGLRQIPNNNRWAEDKSPYVMAQDKSPYVMAQDKSPYVMAQDKSPYAMAQDNQTIAEDNYGRSLAADNDPYGANMAEDTNSYGTNMAEDTNSYGINTAEDINPHINQYGANMAEDTNPYNMTEEDDNPYLMAEDEPRRYSIEGGEEALQDVPLDDE